MAGRKKPAGVIVVLQHRAFTRFSIWTPYKIMQYDEYLITGSNHGFMCRAPCGLMNDGRCDPPNPLANCIVPCALCYVHCAVCISCVHCATCIALSPYCWAYTALTFVIPVLRPLTMVLTNVNVVLSTELAREGCFFKFCGSLCTQRCNKQTSPGLLDMSDDFWMKCRRSFTQRAFPRHTMLQSIANFGSSSVDPTNASPKTVQVRPDEDRLWTMLQNYRLKGVIHFLVQIEKRTTSPTLMGSGFIVCVGLESSWDYFWGCWRFRRCKGAGGFRQFPS